MPIVRIWRSEPCASTRARPRESSKAATRTAHVIRARMWASMARSAQGMGQPGASRGGPQHSVHLEDRCKTGASSRFHMRARSDESARAMSRRLRARRAVAYASADEIERTPRVLLRWRHRPTRRRSCCQYRPVARQGVEPTRRRRPTLVYAVLKRLGPSEMFLGGTKTLANTLQIA
jgi:hypothetical protein